jgi:hypothetical protein
LFLEITSPVIALMIASFLLHDMTALWDVSYAVTLRDVSRSSSTCRVSWKWCH